MTTDLPGSLEAAHRMITDLRLRLSRARALAAWHPTPTSRFLFIGGPRHGETLYATGPAWRVAVPTLPEALDWNANPTTSELMLADYTECQYERRQIGAPASEQARTVYVLSGITPTESLEHLRELVLVAWIAANPDAQHSCTTPGCPDS